MCNYPETVTLTDLPSWVTHNTVSDDFTIPLNTDLSLIGEHVVTIKSEIFVPTDYTNSAFTTMTVEYPFSIYIEPCIITDFTTVPIGKITYTIGSPAILSETYRFTQEPACNYPVTITISGLPSFANHDTSAQNFALPKTEDLSLHAMYDVTLRAEF